MVCPARTRQAPGSEPLSSPERSTESESRRHTQAAPTPPLTTFIRDFADSREVAAGRDTGPLSAIFTRAERIAGIVDRKSTRLNSSHVRISYAVFCLKKKKTNKIIHCQYTVTKSLAQ